MKQTLAEHIRRLWAERSHCINPVLPTDMPDFARELAVSAAWHEKRMERAGEIDREIGEAVKALRELGVVELMIRHRPDAASGVVSLDEDGRGPQLHMATLRMQQAEETTDGVVEGIAMLLRQRCTCANCEHRERGIE